MTELVMPKVDGDVLFGSEASALPIDTAIEAGENITALKVVYIKANDGKAYVSDTATLDDIRADGIAITTATSGNDTNILVKGTVPITCTAGEVYYLGAAGAISTTRSAVKIGVAVDTNKLFIDIVQDDRDMVGTIKAYQKDFTGIPSNNVSAFWAECDGSVLSDTESPLNGQTLPSLNDSGAGEIFLYGDAASGNIKSENYLPSHKHSLTTSDSGGGLTSTGSGITNSAPMNNTTSGTAWKGHSTIWVIKIK